jgi:hypothetical protein
MNRAASALLPPSFWNRPARPSMKRAASALLPPSFWPCWSRAIDRSASTSSMSSVRAGPLRRRPAFQARDGRARVLDGVALGVEQDSLNSARAASAAGPRAGHQPTTRPGQGERRLGGFVSGEGQPLGAQDAHLDLVPVAAVALDCLAQPAFDPKAGLLVGAIARVLKLKTVSPTRCRPSRSKAWASISRWPRCPGRGSRRRARRS